MAARRTTGAAKRRNPRAGPIDVYVGNRVRQLRLTRGITQQSLARSLGITFQQLQKNERGTNRIGSSRLFALSVTLGVPVQHFFDEMPDHVVRGLPSAASNHLARAALENVYGSLNRETAGLLRAFKRIKDPSVRKRVFQLAKLLGDE